MPVNSLQQPVVSPDYSSTSDIIRAGGRVVAYGAVSQTPLVVKTRPALGSALALTSGSLNFSVLMNKAGQPHVHQGQQAQDEILRAMSPGLRLQIAQELYETAWQIKAAGLRRQHPDWPEEFLLAKLRRVFVTGYAGA